MGEFELIRDYFARHKQSADGVVLGIGDDAALLNLSANKQLAVSTDTLVESVHFPSQCHPRQLAQRALRVNLSDMAAMGAKPRWFTLSLSLPHIDSSWASEFAAGLFEDASAFDCNLVGGDTTKAAPGAMSISITVMGEVEPSMAIQRDGAKPGDIVMVSGELGAAMSHVLRQFSTLTANDKQLSTAFWLPTPQIKLAQAIAPWVSAGCDISDGLVGDLGHICQASQCHAVLSITKLPVAKMALTAMGEEQADRLALSGGDEYQLCVTVSPLHQARVMTIAKQLGVKLTSVGVLRGFEREDVAAKISILDRQGNDYSLLTGAYDHFSGV